jgi:hypothetical protein
LIQSSTIVAKAEASRRIEYERPERLMITDGNKKLRKREALAITSSVLGIAVSAAGLLAACTVM